MFVVSVTNNDWFSFIRNARTAEANFWTPTPWRVRTVPRGSRWYFLRKAPVRKIGGYGQFEEYLELRLEEAWQRYGQENGFATLGEFRDTLEMIAERRVPGYVRTGNPVIGNVRLSGIECYSDLNQIDPSTTGLKFPSQVVKFKKFDGAGIDLQC